MPVHRFWALLMEDCVTAYYSHPWAWDEIGFGGPAYPRGYMRLENGLPEPWERDEQRYEWNAPVDSVSELDEEGAPPEHGSLHGHGGSHCDVERIRPRSHADASSPDAEVRRKRNRRLLHRRRGLGRRRSAAAAGARGISRRRAGSRAFLGYGKRLGQRRERLARTLLERSAHHRRHASAGAGREQQRQGRGRRLGPLGSLYAALSSFRLSHLHAKMASASTGRSPIGI